MRIPDTSLSTISSRFWAKVAKGEGCWEWSGARSDRNYGQLKVHGRGVVYAHRLSWELHNGSTPGDLVVCHHCDNPPCVNPAHLFLGTRSDNALDMVSKGRHRARRQPLCHRGHAKQEGPNGYWYCRECNNARRRNGTGQTQPFKPRKPRSDRNADREER